MGNLPRVEDPNFLFVPLLQLMPFPQSCVRTTQSKSILSNGLLPALIIRPLIPISRFSSRLSFFALVAFRQLHSLPPLFATCLPPLFATCLLPRFSKRQRLLSH